MNLSIASFSIFLWEAIPFVILHFFTVVFLFRRMRQFIAYEDKPALCVQEGLESSCAPKTYIKMGLFIENFTQFDTVEGFFTANVIVWFKFNPKDVSCDLVDLFSFERGEIIKKNSYSKVTSQKTEDSLIDEMIVYYVLELKYFLELSQKGFPLESHIIYIVIDNKAFSGKSVAFDAAQSGFSLQNLHITNEWKAIGNKTEAGFIREEIDKSDPTMALCYPRAIFSIDCARRGKRNAFVYMLPMALIFYLTFFSLILDPESKTQAMIMGPLLSVGVPGFIAYSYVLARVVPHVGYFTLLDQIYMLYLGATFVVTVIQIFVSKVPLKWAASLIAFKKTFFVIIVICMIGGLYFIFFGPFSKKPKKL